MFIGWLASYLIWVSTCSNQQGSGVGVEEPESEGFSTWGVGVAENFNDSDSGQTFCSPIVTVCVTNMRRRHTWQFKQLNVSTRDDHGYSEGRQGTNLHTFVQVITNAIRVTRWNQNQQILMKSIVFRKLSNSLAIVLIPKGAIIWNTSCQ